MTLFWGRVECEAAVGSNVRSVPPEALMRLALTKTLISCL